MGDESTVMKPATSEQAVFAEALRCAAPGARAAYLERACGPDGTLRQRVEALLRAAESACDFLENPPTGLANGDSAALFAGGFNSEKPGDRIGRYKLLQQIGEGGCGVVYMADQETPVRRRVALKVIKLGMDTKSVIARFEAERQALALMDHPNIARVLDAGATETGRPYFVMELVRGIRITDYCDENNLSTEERLRLFTQVCHAVQHAHQKGIIHRDLKPSNILVTRDESAPVPKVIDFGIAKATTDQRLTDKTVFTAFEQFIGTPAYMSPEQAMMTSLDIDTRTDIYALGVLLYELLTGQTPFDAKELMASGLDSMRRIIREQEPARPSTRLSTLVAADLTTVAKHRHAEPARLGTLLRGDLDWIVMKALEKDRTRRYETANGLAADIQRHLANEPVTARPPSNVYRIQKMVRRNKLAFAAVSAVAVALLFGLGISSWLFLREKSARLRAEAAEHEQGRLLAEAEEARVNERTLRVQTGEQMNYLGVQFLNDGELDAAERTLRRAFAIHRKLLSNEDGNTVMAAGNLAIVLTKQGRTEEAAAVIDELLPADAESRIENFGLLCFRAQYRVNCGNFSDAASDMDKAVRLKPADGVAWLRWAVLLIGSEDFDGYERLREAMLAQSGRSVDPRLAEQTAKTCLLLPWSEEKYTRTALLAESTAAPLPAETWAAFAQGLSAFRQKQFPFTIARGQAALELGGTDAPLEVAAHAVIAMAQTAAGQKIEGEATLRHAREIARTRLIRLSPLTPFEENWHNILVAELLLREATSLILP